MSYRQQANSNGVDYGLPNYHCSPGLYSLLLGAVEDRAIANTLNLIRVAHVTLLEPRLTLSPQTEDY